MEYKVYENNGANVNASKCIRKFESLDEAREWCWTVDTGKSYVIVFKYEDEDYPRHIFA